MSSPYEPPSEPEWTRPRVVWPLTLLGCGIPALLLMVCGGVLFYAYRQVSGEGEIAQQVSALFEAIEAGRAAEFYESSAAAELRQTTSQEHFVRYAERIHKDLGALKSKSNINFQLRSQNLTTFMDAAYDCQFEHGQAIVRVRYKREEGTWRLVTLRIESKKDAEQSESAEHEESNPAQDEPGVHAET